MSGGMRLHAYCDYITNFIIMTNRRKIQSVPAGNNMPQLGNYPIVQNASNVSGGSNRKNMDGRKIINLRCTGDVVIIGTDGKKGLTTLIRTNAIFPPES